MTEHSALTRLAAMAGVATEYRDAFGNRRQVGAETLHALLAAMGFRCTTDHDVAASLAELEVQPWLTPLDPVTVIDAEEPHPALALALDDETTRGTAEWVLTLEGGERREGASPVAEMRVIETRDVAGRRLSRRALALPAGLPLGYHAIDIRVGPVADRSTIIVAPATCHLPEELGEGRRAWGLTTQLYALRSERNWGMGDFTDLATAAAGAARHGAKALGVNPLHALFPAEPRHISPYSPSSRLYLNDLYIDADAVPDFAEDEAVRAMIRDPEFGRRLSAAKDAELIDHATVAACKRPVFERLYAGFRERHLGSRPTERGRAFRRFQQEGGESLRRFAVFQALHERALRDGFGFCWRDWPSGWRDPGSPEVARFAEEHRERVELYQYLQWEADRQLGAAARRARDAGLAIGLYRDLAVGVDPNGGEAWSDQELLVPGAAIGAPPDPLSLKGQNWGLAPISPVALRRRAYAPFVAALRANMRHAGVLRIDHVMALTHLYWVPSGAEATAGAYVDYPFRDLLRILALESRRHRCAVIGEDLGTVPEGFRETMNAANVLSYRVLMFERRPGGAFTPPHDYPPMAAASVSTHDIATLKGYWLARDVDWRERLDLYPEPGLAQHDRDARARDRHQLLDALVEAGVLAPEKRQDLIADGGAAHTPELAEAVHRFLARSNTRFMLVQIEDAAGEVEQANLPGTVDQHPNWRRKLSRPLEEILEDPAFARLAAVINEARGRG